MTTRNEQEAKVQGLELGADDYLIKPLNLLELSARIKSMLRLKALHDELQEANRTLAMQNDVLQTLSTTDPLMKIYNRLFFEKRFKYEFQRAQRYSKSLALMELDLDYFKRINDTYGHPFGDLVLQRVAELLITSVRASDIVARWGGEEIVILLPELNLDQAKQAAERIRSIIESTEFCDSDITMRETVSIGVIVYPDSRVYRYQDMFKFVDEALYFAKEAGRNCVRVSLDSKGGDKNP
jgi:diguanylate cyclase (GGDEF)-like protein